MITIPAVFFGLLDAGGKGNYVFFSSLVVRRVSQPQFSASATYTCMAMVDDLVAQRVPHPNTMLSLRWVSSCSSAATPANCRRESVPTMKQHVASIYHTCSFNAERVASGIEKLKNARKNASQKRMDR